MKDPREIEAKLAQSRKKVLASQNAVLSEALAAALQQGLSTQALAKLFRMDHSTAKARLIDCPPKTNATRSRSTTGLVMYYDLAVAAEYLVTPKLKPEDVLKHVQTAALPPQFQKAFWDAKLARQRYEESAGQLWRTEKVQEVLASTFQNLKFAVQLWLDAVETETQVTPRQREIIQRLVDGLQQDMYDTMCEMAKASQTGPVLSEETEDRDEKPQDRASENRGRRDLL